MSRIECFLCILAGLVIAAVTNLNPQPSYLIWSGWALLLHWASNRGVK